MISVVFCFNNICAFTVSKLKVILGVEKDKKTLINIQSTHETAGVELKDDYDLRRLNKKHVYNYIKELAANMNLMKKIAIVFLLLLSLSSCNVIKAFIELNKKESTIYSYKLGEKDIKFCTMHHLGKPEFYQDVKRQINNLKNSGYIVFYEKIAYDNNLDSLVTDTIKRKFRKIIGFYGSYDKILENNKLFNKYILQPDYKALGIDNNDIRADANYSQLINEYERKFGFIRLDQDDFKRQLTPGIYEKKIITKKQYNYLIIAYRNNILIEKIINCKQDKILIIYGLLHKKDF